MKLGGPIMAGHETPESWVKQLRRKGYSAAYFPLSHEEAPARIDSYVEAAARAGVIIAEVGAWSNPLSGDADERQRALELCKNRLALADRVGARCCVNISGSRAEQWDGPHPLNLTEETFERVVESVREIIDAVRPTRTFYTLEPMPWMYPDSADSYLELIRAVDRKQFGVHFDPVNLVCSPQQYYGSGQLIREFVSKLGPYIRSCHAKDIRLSTKLTVHLDEVRPGLGELDYRALLNELNTLSHDLPLMLEHLQTETEYEDSARFIRSVADEMGISVS